MRKRRKKRWSYNAGERGRNWVRAFQQPRDGKFYLEWYGDGRRRAVLLKGVTTPEAAKQKADDLAAGFAELMDRPEAPTLTLRSLMADYVKEVTPTKSFAGTREYDGRAMRLWLASSGACLRSSRRRSAGRRSRC